MKKILHNNRLNAEIELIDMDSLIAEIGQTIKSNHLFKYLKWMAMDEIFSMDR